MQNTSDATTMENPIAEQQKALDELINDLGNVIGKDNQSAWIKKVVILKNAASVINQTRKEKGESNTHQLTYDADKVDAATNLVSNITKIEITSPLNGIKPLRKTQQSYMEQNSKRSPTVPDGSAIRI